MDIYEVYVFCDECNDSHDMSICISLDDGPVEKESIGSLYAGKELPPGIRRLIVTVHVIKQGLRSSFREA